MSKAAHSGVTPRHIPTIKVGCDVIALRRFSRSLRAGGRLFLERVFTDEELEGNPPTESLAGMFAAKEAALKALDWPAGQWKKITISKLPSGRPVLELDPAPPGLVSSDLSISHDAGLSLAVVVLAFA